MNIFTTISDMIYTLEVMEPDSVNVEISIKQKILSIKIVIDPPLVIQDMTVIEKISRIISNHVLCSGGCEICDPWFFQPEGENLIVTASYHI
ncbi:MAG: hypothetical protein ACOCUT_00110 [bacterium]